MPIAINGSGTVTGLSVGGLPDGVITPAELSGGVASNGPAFSAYQSVAQSLTGTSWNKIVFQTEEFDTANCFDNTTNYRFQPNIAGYYQISGAFGITSTIGDMVAAIAKNGTRVKNGAEVVTGSGGGFVSALIYLNGSTDYVELQGYIGTGTQNSLAGQSSTWFQGQLARADTGGIVPAANTIGASGKILLGTYTTSAAANTILSGWYQSQFDQYEIEMNDVRPTSNNDAMRMQVSTDNGSTFQASNYASSILYNFASTAGAGSAENATFIDIGGARSNAANAVASATFKLSDPAGPNHKTFVSTHGVAQPTPPTFYVAHAVGTWKSTSAYNAIRFYMASGTHSGTFKIYGLTK